MTKNYTQIECLDHLSFFVSSISRIWDRFAKFVFLKKTKVVIIRHINSIREDKEVIKTFFPDHSFANSFIVFEDFTKEA